MHFSKRRDFVAPCAFLAAVSFCIGYQFGQGRCDAAKERCGTSDLSILQTGDKSWPALGVEQAVDPGSLWGYCLPEQLVSEHGGLSNAREDSLYLALWPLTKQIVEGDDRLMIPGTRLTSIGFIR
jgi:hypothetical protein